MSISLQTGGKAAAGRRGGAAAVQGVVIKAVSAGERLCGAGKIKNHIHTRLN